jgi:proteasome lid subunit RPN8/RPN11
MSEPRVTLAPPQEPRPRRAHMPLKHALRWRSLFESQEHPGAVSVFITPRAFVRCCAHAGSDLDNEVGGWLVGKWRADHQTGAHFITVESVLPARHTRFGSAFLTFTQDSQVWLYNQLQEYYPNRELVGWYHTHPRMGVFLSEYDSWLHRNFFPEIYQVALVIEPHSATGGFFVRSLEDGGLDPHRYYGFYELNNRRKRSVVHWHNVFPEVEMITEEGG